MEEITLIEFFVLFEWRYKNLSVPMWVSGDDLVFPNAITKEHKRHGHQPPITWKGKETLKNMGYVVDPKDPYALVDFFDEREDKKDVIARLVRKFSGQYQGVDGLTQTVDGHHITSTLQLVDENLLRHLSGPSFDLLGRAFGKQAELNPEFHQMHFQRLQPLFIEREVQKMKRL